MSEKLNTTSTTSNKAERGDTYLVKTEGISASETQIRSLRATGRASEAQTFDRGSFPATEVGISLDKDNQYMDSTFYVPDSALTDEAQHQLARELTGKPLRGDKVLVNFGDSVREATIEDYQIGSDGKEYGVAVDPNDAKKYVGVSPEHLTLEFQGMLRKEGGATLEAYGFKPVRPEDDRNYQFSPQAAEARAKARLAALETEEDPFDLSEMRVRPLKQPNAESSRPFDRYKLSADEVLELAKSGTIPDRLKSPSSPTIPNLQEKMGPSSVDTSRGVR